jgi:hypothetical protein
VSEPVVTDLENIDAPYGRKVLLQNVAHESGLTLLRIRIREGNRFTILDIDIPTAKLWADRMQAWAAANATTGAAGEAE